MTPTPVLSSVRAWQHLASWVGLIMPPAFVAVLAWLTWHQRSFLDDVGWSPIERTPVAWPSLLALGPGGATLVVTFVIAGLCAFCLAVGYGVSTPGRIGKATAAAIGVVGVGLLCVAFRVDPPSTSPESWHSVIHNRGYLLIPSGALLAIGLMSITPGRPLVRRCCRALLPFAVVAFAATNIDGIAQLARYFAFSALLVWVAVVGWSTRSPLVTRTES